MLQLPLTLFVLVLIYVVVVMIYRLTLHPLAKYPGPSFSKISGFSISWQCATQDRHLIHLAEHRRYGKDAVEAQVISEDRIGPIVRIGPNTLSFSSSRALRQIYQAGREGNPLCKSEYYNTIDVPAGAASLNAETDCGKHAARRRVLDHAFTASALRSNEPYFVDVIDTLAIALTPQKEEEWSTGKDMSKYFSWFAYDVMGALVFGRRFDCLTDPAHRYVPNMIMTSGAFLYIIANLPCQWLIRRLLSSPRLVSWIGGKEEHMFVEYSEACLSQRLKEEDVSANSKTDLAKLDERKDVMHYIINARNKSNPRDHNHQELVSDACLLIAAGSDTTATTLAALLFYLTLSTSTNILHKLNLSIRDRSRFPNVESITCTAATTLPYLRACIDEALRLAPPVVCHLPRTVIRNPGIEIDGQFIPAGTTVGAAAYVLHHDEEVYPDSWCFKPDRWIHDEQSEERAKQISEARRAFIPFSLGSRGCIGKEFAYAEMCLCVARLLYQFDIKRAGQEDCNLVTRTGASRTRSGFPVRQDEYQLYDKFLVDRSGPMVSFRRREPNGGDEDSAS